MSDLPDTHRPSKVEYNKLNDVQQMYVRRFERYNKQRAKGKSKLFAKLRYIGGSMLALSLGTYFYTIYAVKQVELGPEFDQRAGDTSSSSS